MTARTVDQYHDAALTALDASANHDDMPTRTHLIARAAVYAELAKTAPELSTVDNLARIAGPTPEARA